jgi:signal peptidase II
MAMSEINQTSGPLMGTWLTPNRRIALVAALVVVLDQLTKQLVKRCLVLDEEKDVVPGFFKLVHWGNTGAAWSLFSGRNAVLAVVGVVALVVLFRSRHHFDAHTKLGQMALGLIFGGIVGNLADRLIDHYVTDFLYFYLDRRGAGSIGFPAFNVADSAICVGVALIFIASFRNEKPHDAVAH